MRHSLPVLTLFACISATAPLAAEGPTHHTFRYLTTSGEPQTFSTLVFSPDNTQLAISVAGKVDFIDLQLGRITGQYKFSPHALAYTTAGDRIYMISRYADALLDTLTGAGLETNYRVEPGYIGIRLEKQSGKLIITSISADGPVAALGAIKVGDEVIGIAEGRNGYMRNVTGREVEEVIGLMKGSAGTYLQLRVLPQGQFGEQSAVAYTVRRQPGQLRGNTLRFTTLAASETGEQLALCMNDEKHELRNAASGLPVARLETIDIENIGQYAVSPDQTRFAVVARRKDDGSKIAVEVFDIATQDRIAYMPVPKSEFTDIAFAADNDRVLVASWDSIEVAESSKNQFTGRLSLGWVPPPKPEEAEFAGVGATPLIASARAVGMGRADHARSPRMLVSLLAVSAKNVVATADNFGHVKLWDLNTGDLLKELPMNPVENVKAIAFSPDGKWLAYHVDGVLHVVDVSEVEPLTPDEVMQHRQSVEQQSVEQQSQPQTLIPGVTITQPTQSNTFVVQVGAKVEVRSRGRWYPAVIVRDDGGGRWQIHYDDSPEDWDELVTAERMRPLDDR